MGNIRINVEGEVFDVYYEDKIAVAISRMDKKRYEGDCVYSLIDIIKKSNK